MAQKFHEHLNNFLKNDPLCTSLAVHGNKKKIKTLQKEAEDRQKFIEKYSETKKLSILVPLLAEKISALKVAAERFESSYQEVSTTNATLNTRKQAFEKSSKDLANVENLKQTLQDQIEATRNRLTKLEADLSAESLKYAEAKQAELEAEYNKHRETIHDRQTTIKQNQVLKEKMESILKDIKTQSDLMDKDYEEKRAEVSNSKLKSISGFDVCKKELENKADYEKEIEDSYSFCDQVQPDLEIVEKNVQEYEKLFNNSIKDFERPLKKVEKIKKENATLRKANEDAMEKLKQNNVGMRRLVEENAELRNRIQKEEKQKAIFQKLLENLERKMEEN